MVVRLLITSAVLSPLAGCTPERDPNIPVVVYEDLSPEAEITLSVPTWKLGDPQLEFVFDSPVAADIWMGLSGTIEAESLEDRPRIVVAVIKGGMTVENRGSGASRQTPRLDRRAGDHAGKEDAAWEAYEILIQSPAKAGEYQVHFLGEGSHRLEEPFAIGQLTVK